MRTSRRSLLAAGGTGALALTAGCLDFVLGNGPLEFDAERAAPTPAALEDTEYEEREVETGAIDETVEVGVEREVRASYWASSYAKAIEYEGEAREAGVFAAVSLPEIAVADRSFNPIDDMSNEELLTEFFDRVDGGAAIENVRHDDSFTLEILEGTRDVAVFVGETDFAGERVDVELQLATFDHEDDSIVLLGSYPELFVEESAAIEVLMESVEHPV
ncbi:DUF6517 family protein [Halosolutus gelatinilyticus]|uniref:DUF6517 family protein n=1 Tax=Halosolutus gelatinilyticus TaxID=2931975 RepID=UPI001FF308B4|nr:DUF6517 family protein [Halosolutus gelatinilyticus]